MDSFRIKNFRCFEDTDYINLNKLNILVGQNSCGKSTLLRFFPLIKQTLEEKRAEPILWYGRYVDFGDFNQSKNKNIDEENIEITFNFTEPGRYYFLDENREQEIVLKVSLNDKSIDEINLIIEEDKINIKLLGKKAIVRINDNYIRKNLDYQIINNELIPSIGEGVNDVLRARYAFLARDVEQFQEEFFNTIGSELEVLTNLEEKYRKSFYEELFVFLTKNMFLFKSDENSRKAFNEKVTKMSEQYLESEKEGIDKFCNILNSKYESLRNLTLYLNLNWYLGQCNDYLHQYFSNVSYIAPLRANAERYYRIQGLSVQDIDPRGANVAMILKNMNQEETDAFRKWTKTSFGFEIVTEKFDGHISMNIKKNGKTINITDTGFGFSQIIPIIVLLWKTTKINNKKTTIVIEQPELHLHPKMQTQLIDVILDILIKAKNMILIMETHSQTIINHIGKRLEEEKIFKEDVNVLLVNQDKSGNSSITLSNYTEEGYLENWPIGFFNGVE